MRRGGREGERGVERASQSLLSRCGESEGIFIKGVRTLHKAFLQSSSVFFRRHSSSPIYCGPLCRLKHSTLCVNTKYRQHAGESAWYVHRQFCPNSYKCTSCALVDPKPRLHYNRQGHVQPSLTPVFRPPGHFLWSHSNYVGNNQCGFDMQ